MKVRELRVKSCALCLGTGRDDYTRRRCLGCGGTGRYMVPVANPLHGRIVPLPAGWAS